MENCDVPVLPTDNCTGWRVSTRERRPSTGKVCPCCSDYQSPSTIPHADLPVFSSVAPSLQPSTAPLHHDGPLEIHNLSVEEYQQLYHEVVDDMLRFKNIHLRPYNLNTGRVIKQKLWERLNRPMFTETVNEDGLVHMDVSYKVGVYPPLYDVDTSGEPWPKKPPKTQ